MIYVITHKVFKGDKELIKSNKTYKILHVGNNKDSTKDYLRDDVGVNISDKNENYCELTGIFWLWKNSSEQPSEFIGISHYRRYFCSPKEYKKYKNISKIPYPIRDDEYSRILSEYDIIVPVPKKSLRHSVRDMYEIFHDKQSLDYTKNAISKICPDYLESFEIEMNSHSALYANMFITTKSLFDDYSSWLFSILAEVEKNLDLAQYDGLEDEQYQLRVFGFLAERLLQVWIRKNNLNIYHLPVYNTEQKPKGFFDDLVNDRLIPLLKEVVLRKNIRNIVRNK